MVDQLELHRDCLTVMGDDPGNFSIAAVRVPWGWHLNVWGVTVELWAASGNCYCGTENDPNGEKLLEAGVGCADLLRSRGARGR